MVGASNVYNQIIERDLDALMDRTKNRPIPAGRMGVKSAFALASVLTIIGIGVLYTINPQTAMFGAISIITLLIYMSVGTDSLCEILEEGKGRLDLEVFD